VAEDPSVSEDAIRFARAQIDWIGVTRIEKEVNALMNERKYGEALRCVDAGMKPELARSAVERLRALRRWVEEAPELAEFNAVCEKRDPDEIRRAGEAFLQKFPQGRRAESIRSLLLRLPKEPRPE